MKEERGSLRVNSVREKNSCTVWPTERISLDLIFGIVMYSPVMSMHAERGQTPLALNRTNPDLARL